MYWTSPLWVTSQRVLFSYPGLVYSGPRKGTGGKILLATMGTSIHKLLLWVSSQPLLTWTLLHLPHLFHSIIHPFIYQNSLYLSLSKVLGVQRLIVYPQYLAVISTITERSQEECGNLEKDHLELTGTFQEDFPEEGVLELSLTRCRMPFRQRWQLE